MNRLELETSPYLRQHAENPVDWYPWCDEALQHAKDEDKPILLSIGYSSCHWCHVMAHESFEDENTAAVMNELYINIKVDREERPDLDKIYQMAHNSITGRSGGWPLTLFLHPHSHIPFFAGTYFPKRSRFQLPAFVDILRIFSETYKTRRDDIEKLTSQVMDALKDRPPDSVQEHRKSDVEIFKDCRDIFIANYDQTSGGFGSSPKFPQPVGLARLLRTWHSSVRTGQSDQESLNAVLHTLTQMARGGIYDQIGGGFFRYSTDRNWMIPHFEKMLYDNALLLNLYVDAAKIGGDLLFQEVVRDTSNWICNEMEQPGGGYYAAIDADSDGEEGKYYVWRRNEVQRLLNEEEYLVLETLYGLDKSANFENRWHFRRTDSWPSVARRLSLDEEFALELRESARAKLRQARSERVKPLTDTKILTAWNGLALGALARASQLLSDEELLKAAQRTADFIRLNVFDGSRLKATWCDGKAQFNGYLDDYAFMLDGLLNLLAVEWRKSDIEMALALGESMIEWFFDKEEGGFWFTAHDHETLIQRPKPIVDEALPSGNGAACSALIRLANLTGDTKYSDIVHESIERSRRFVEKNEATHATLVGCIDDQFEPADHVILRGPADETTAWVSIATEMYNPKLQIWSIPYHDPGYVPSYLPHLISIEDQQQVTAYICKNMVCSPPIRTLEEFRATLSD